MLEVIFLYVFTLVWIIFATIQDLKKREVANWLNFSLIIFVLGFRFFYSLFSAEDFSFFYQGLIGLGIFFGIGNLLYYGKMFAGGDAKLMIALGTILPFFSDFNSNLKVFLTFFIIFLLVGAAYSLGASIFLSFKNFKRFRKEFIKQRKKNKRFLLGIIFISLILLVLGFYEKSFVILAIFVFVLPYVYIYVKAVDESCMVKKINTKKLQEGDWLYEDLRFGKKIIKAKWAGVSKKEISFLRRNKSYVLGLLSCRFF